MINYIIIAYATMLILMADETNSRQCNNFTQIDAGIVALAPISFPIFIGSLTYVAITGNGIIDCNITKTKDTSETRTR
ncbi:MAG: hypothetical protein J7L15_04530 [Clostridiales bacterium]|nr:hypothetical protein [Clostridiales bacterium]